MTLSKIYILGKIVCILLGFFLVQLILGVFLLHQISLNQAKNALETLSNRIHADIVYTNGRWDTNRYNADPNIQANSPVYILANDGFVIDRWKPIHGFLDTSDIKHLLTYTSPQTITTSTQQSWRILSIPIKENDQILGTITVAAYNPSLSQLDGIDQRLTQTIQLLQAK